jgi:hypothetical protein
MDTCNFNTQEVKTGDHEFKTNLDYIVQPCLKKTRVRDVALQKKK